MSLTNTNKMDTKLLFLLFCLCIFSLVAIYSGSGQYVQDNPFYFVINQLLWYLIGSCLMFVVAIFDYELLKKWAFPLCMSGIALLLLVHFFGTEKNGAQRWLNLGFFEVQPSELMKVFLIIYISFIFSKVKNRKSTIKDSVPLVIKTVICSLIPFLLIFAQPDLGSALVILGTTASLLVVSKISFKMILLLASCLTGILTFFAYLFYFHHEIITQILKPHQLSRIYAWLEPGQYATNYGYQLQQAEMGIGSGQLTGKGLENGVQVQSGRIPEVHTDFIFAVIGEEFGFIGSSLLILIYFFLIYRIVQISLHANTHFGAYICIGTVGLLGFQVFQNIGMTIGLMPITGIALPFISYGGSALLTNFIALGLVLSIQTRSKRYIFSENQMS